MRDFVKNREDEKKKKKQLGYASICDFRKFEAFN